MRGSPSETTERGPAGSAVRGSAGAAASDAPPQADGHGGKALDSRARRCRRASTTTSCSSFTAADADAEAAGRPSGVARVEAEWRERVRRARPHGRAARRAHAYAVLAGLTSPAAAWSPRRRPRCPSAPRRAATTTTATSGFATSATPARPSPGPARYPLMDDAVRFVTERLLERRPRAEARLHPTGGPRARPAPARPAGLSRAARDIVGNWVNEQFQLDAFGETLLLLAAAAGHDHLDADGWRAAETAVAAIEQRWREGPDAGIWELDPDAWTHSRLICAAGLRAIADARGPGRAGRRAGSPRRTRSSPTPPRTRCIRPDAGSARPSDPRRRRGAAAARRSAARCLRLTRVRSPRCAVVARAHRRWLLLPLPARRATARRGRGSVRAVRLLDGARRTASRATTCAAARWFERNRAACGPPGLFSEEFDVSQRQLRGNLPQAFVHALLLECAVEQYSPTEPDGVP